MVLSPKLILRSGVVIDDPGGTASRIMAEEWAYYDGLSPGDPDRIEPADVLATVSVNSFVNDAKLVRQVHRGLSGACDDLLRALPRNVSLLDADLETVAELIAAACSVAHVLIPVATKVLHRKRAAMVPMLDNVVLGHYFNYLGRPELIGWSQDKRRVGAAAKIALDGFKTDLEAAEHELNEIATRLDREGTPVTLVRLLEMLLWCGIEPVGYYRRPEVSD